MLRYSVMTILGITLALGLGAVAEDPKDKDTEAKTREVRKEVKKDDAKDADKDAGRVVHTKTLILLQGTGVRTSNLTGMDVVNNRGEHLGTVSDMVVDVETGKIQYVATSYGGFLGIGDKMFAIPFKALKFSHARDDADHKLFVLDMEKEALKNAPGFDQNHWPGTENSEYWVRIDKFYKVDSTKAAERPTEKAKQ